MGDLQLHPSYTPDEYNAAVLARFHADKQAEWDRLEQDDWETAHGMYNDTMGYVRWKQAHECTRYPDYAGTHCAICGRALSDMKQQK